MPLRALCQAKRFKSVGLQLAQEVSAVFVLACMPTGQSPVRSTGSSVGPGTTKVPLHSKNNDIGAPSISNRASSFQQSKT